MTGQAMGNLSPLHQLGNRKVNGTQFSGFPFNVHPDQKDTFGTFIVSIIAFFLPSSVCLLTCYAQGITLLQGFSLCLYTGITGGRALEARGRVFTQCWGVTSK